MSDAHRDPSTFDHQAASGRVFLVHIRLDADPSSGKFYGRVQHVRSGDAEHFETLDELAAFVSQRLKVEGG